MPKYITTKNGRNFLNHCRSSTILGVLMKLCMHINIDKRGVVHLSDNSFFLFFPENGL